MTRQLPIDADRLWRRLMAMAEIGATPAGGSNRQALSDDDQAGRDLLVEWVTAAGCTVATDPVGNLFAIRAGSDSGADPVVLGSHLDTQPTGGRFDGVYGVLGGLEVIESLNDHNVNTTAPIGLAVWTNEEGSRFPVSMMGSAVWAGTLELAAARALVDVDGISVGEELDRLGWPGALELGEAMGAYLELHIEQGPILENSGSEIGIVTGVQGFRWMTLTITGQPAHAGPTPMNLRRDPSRAVAQILTGLYRIADDNAPEARVTPAQFNSTPQSPNTVPEEITFTLDFRNPDLEVLDEMERQIRSLIEAAASDNGCQADIRLDNDSAPVVFDPECVAAVQAATEAQGLAAERLVSGAGHDACWVAVDNRAGMIFVPCLDGLSHNESESITPEAAASGVAVLYASAVSLAGIAHP